MDADQQEVVLNGRNVVLDGLALEVMRAMDKSSHEGEKAAFDRGYSGGRRWGEEERQKLASTLVANAWDRVLANDALKDTRAKLSVHELRQIIETIFTK